MNAELLVRLKREKNLLKWGEQNHPNGTGTSPLRDMHRAAAQTIVDKGMRNGTVTYFDILNEEVQEVACETDDEKVLAEMIDVAAVAMDWADSILRKAERNVANAEERT